MSVFALNLVIGLGLGLAIDYTLFLLTRYREELARQGPTLGAIVTTMRTAGRTVAFSAATVAVALAALTVFPLGFIKSMGIAGAVVAVVAAVAALVISPALFALWGAKLARKESRRPEESGRWYRLSHAVMRRPGAVAAATGVVMLALAVPALRAEWTPVDSSVIPTDKSARTVADAVDGRLRRHRRQPRAGRGHAPRTPPRSRRTPSGSTALPGVVSAGAPVQLDATTWQLDLVAAGEPEGETARRLVDADAGRLGARGRRAGRRERRGVRRPAGGDRLPAAAGRRAGGRPDPAGAVADDRLGGAAGQGGA